MNSTDKLDKQQIATDLAATQASYHELLAHVSADVWNRKSANSDMLVKELMWHMAWAMGWLARGVGATRGGRQSVASRIPAGLADPARKIAMRILARRATPERAARTYDAGHEALLAELNTVTEPEWQLSTVRFGEHRTVAWHFRQPVDHFAEHSADVLAVIPGNRERRT